MSGHTSKRRFRSLFFSAAGLATLAASTVARGAVTLKFNDGDPLAADAVKTSAAPGASFSVNLLLTSGGESVSGVNYDVVSMNAAGTAPVSDVFRLTGRSLTTPSSPYADISGVLTDLEVQTSAKLLAPDTQRNLGSTARDEPTEAGTFQVARLTFQVQAGAAPGVYTIHTQSPFNDPFVGYAQGEHPFGDLPFDGHAVYTVTVTPEPGAMMVVAGTLAPVLLRRRRTDASR